MQILFYIIICHNPMTQFKELCQNYPCNNVHHWNVLECVGIGLQCVGMCWNGFECARIGWNVLEWV